jgi:DNA-binding transcriptional LysR family regulator
MNISSFDLNLLRVFDAMMAERNVTRAARRVFLSQPATSHALARLEKRSAILCSCARAAK